MTIAVLGIDLGKNSCSVAGLDETGRVVLRRRLTRDGVVRLAAGLPACVVAMEAWLAARIILDASCASKATRSD
jgi:transposase